MSRFTSPDFLKATGGNRTRAEPPPLVDLSRPTLARLTSFQLGGKDHFDVDRELALRADRAAHGFKDLVEGERAFLQRAVRHLAREHGIDQFLQFGAGLPTPGDPHQIALEHVPGARVLYASDDPAVVAHNRAMLTDGETTTVVHGSPARPEELLRDPELRRFLDLERPVGLLLSGALSHVHDSDDPAGCTAALREALAPGSHLVLSHFCRPDPGSHPRDALRAQQLERTFLDQLGTGRWRTRAEIEGFFDGWRLREPGLIDVQYWRPLPSSPPVHGSYQMPARNRRLLVGGVASL
ncbi:SAM-dependent methyltransferase [Nocardiopsis sp. HNM0947]|uniref:SAM-dependent methyltransferase n=1 Tax=Nocardiopsis coralli TaxID=2772213 RepID=A0ABR9P0X6_9ACTN|nr:SAM-dependent methyltransferase [Nocardiopsis coralli]MBE2997471.1 SAM-dependent methyltransferase [Nocardiopsis coralli]